MSLDWGPGPASNERDLQINSLSEKYPEAVVDRPRYYVATATFWAMIIMHHTLLLIALNVRIFLKPAASGLGARIDVHLT